MLAFLQFIAMAVQAVFLSKTLGATKDAANAAQQAANAANKSAEVAENALTVVERPYVFVEVIGNIERTMESGGFPICRCTYTVKNHGKIPAIITNINCDIWWGGLNDGLPTIEEPTGEHIPPGGVIISAGADKSFNTERTMGLSDAINAEGANTKLICYGRIGYKDYFKRTHHTKFCWEFQNRISERGFFLSNNKDLNDYT